MHSIVIVTVVIVILVMFHLWKEPGI